MGAVTLGAVLVWSRCPRGPSLLSSRRWPVVHRGVVYCLCLEQHVFSALEQSRRTIQGSLSRYVVWECIALQCSPSSYTMFSLLCSCEIASLDFFCATASLHCFAVEEPIPTSTMVSLSDMRRRPSNYVHPVLAQFRMLCSIATATLRMACMHQPYR